MTGNYFRSLSSYIDTFKNNLTAIWQNMTCKQIEYCRFTSTIGANDA